MLEISKTKREEYSLTENFVSKVFQNTDYSNGVVEKALVREIREKQYYIPQLDLLVKKDGMIIGHCMLSKFPIGKHFWRSRLFYLPCIKLK